MVRKIVLSLIAVFVFLAYATAQNRQISGTVSDANGHPVAGATVIVDGTSLGTTTNTAGEYTLSAPANGTLVVTFVGFEPQQLPIAGKTRINVTMKEDAQAIDDVIVVAFGTAKKEAFTGSAAVVKGGELQKRVVGNVTKSFEGTVAGVQVASGGGQPGEAAVDQQGGQHQGLPHGGAGPVQAKKRDVEAPQAKGGADALVQQIPGQDVIQVLGHQPALFQSPLQHPLLHGGLRLLPGVLPEEGICRNPASMHSG